MEIYDSDTYAKALRETPRAGEAHVQAFYEHRIGAICKDPKLMLMPWDDHLVHRGDGVFETLKWVDRKIYQLDAHIARMKNSGRAIHLEPPCTWEKLREIILEVARASESGNGLVRILLGRGPGGFGIDPFESPVPSLYVVAYDFTPKPDAWYEKGVTAFKTDIPAKQPYMAVVKTTNYLPNVLMKRDALLKGYDYPFCFDRHGFLAEGSTENVCLVNREGSLIIPEFTNALAGTTLMRAVDLVKGDYSIVFRSIREDEILEAREVMVFGTTINAISVVRFKRQAHP